MTVESVVLDSEGTRYPDMFATWDTPGRAIGYLKREAKKIGWPEDTEWEIIKWSDGKYRLMAMQQN